MSDNKQISIVLATAVGLGAIIGAGIFVLSGTVIALAGAWSLLAFVLVGIIAVIVALEFGELASMMPKLKGASYSYVYKAFGSELGFITGVMLYFSYIAAIAAISLGFGSYLASLLGISTNYAVYSAIVLIAIVTVVNLFGIRRTTKVDFGLVSIKLLILLLFVGFALIYASNLGHLTVSYISGAAGSFSLAALFAASVAIFFAYTGFQTISTFASRIRGGAGAAGKAILYAVLISITIYILVDIALLMLVPAGNYTTVNADPLTFALTYAGAPGWLIIAVGIGAIIATASATLAMMLSSSRVMYQMSSDHLLPGVFRKFDADKDVASNAVMISGILGIVMLLWLNGSIYIIATVSNFGTIFSYIMSSFALMHYRRIKTKADFRVPLYPYLPIVGIVGLLSLMYGMPQYTLAVGVIFILVMIIVYYALREIERKKIIRVRLFS